MKRKLRIIWCILAPVALVGGLIFFLAYISLVNFLIWYGICIVINLPMLIAAVKDDATGNGRIATFLIAVLLAPIWLIISWFYTVSSLRKGGTGINWFGKGKKRRSNDNNETSDSRTNAVGDAMERAIRNVVSNSSNYAGGRYVRIARKDVSSVVTRMAGIKIYGSITYEAHHIGPERSVSEYQQDIKECLTRTQQNLLNAAQRAVQQVRQNYKGYDNDWGIEVSLQPEVR